MSDNIFTILGKMEERLDYLQRRTPDELKSSVDRLAQLTIDLHTAFLEHEMRISLQLNGISEELEQAIQKAGEPL